MNGADNDSLIPENLIKEKKNMSIVNVNMKLHLYQ